MSCRERGMMRWRPEGVLRAVAARPSTPLLVAGVLFVVAVVVVAMPGDRLPLEPDLAAMHPHPNPALAAQETIAKRMGTAPGALVVYLRADSPEELVRTAHAVQRRLASLDVKAAGVNPLQHYISYGADEGRDPSANFDTDNYLLVNTDVAAAHVNPLVHFLDYGIYEGRDPMPETYLNISFSGPNGQHLLVETQPNIWIEDNHYVFNELGESDYGLLLHDYARGVEIQIRFGTGQVSEYQPLETDQYSVTSVTEYGKPHIPEGWIV